MSREWGIGQIWNKSLEKKNSRPVTPRDHIWASELGKAPVDIWLKMKGVEPSNPPNIRSLRKFEAGNIWEWIMGLVLKRAGILQESQKWVKYQYDGLVPVTGKIDFMAGGKPEINKSMESLTDLGLPDIFIKAGEKIVNYLQKKYPDGLDARPVEIKSTGSFMFDNIEKSNSPSSNHSLQLFHYMKALGMPFGTLFYVCKDDARIHEIIIQNPSAVEDKYKSHIEEITKYYKEDKQPPLESPIVYSEEFEKFSKNWKVAYSQYLTKLYGFKDQKEFDDKYQSIVGSWNRVVDRAKKKKEFTENNRAKLGEMIEYGIDVDSIPCLASYLDIEDKPGVKDTNDPDML